MRRAWLIACTLAEAVGIAGVGVLFAAVSRGDLAAPVGILGAGLWEGSLLGLAQALVLRRAGVPPGRWVLATVAMATAGYAGSLAFGAGGPDPAVPPPDPALWVIVAGAAAMGVGMGALMGAAQWMAAREVLSPGRWILGNVLGWTPAMVAIFLPATQVTPTMTYPQIALAGAAGGAVAGLCVGLGTLAFLPPSRKVPA